MRNIYAHKESNTIVIYRTLITSGVIMELDYLFRQHPYDKVTLQECNFRLVAEEVNLYHQLTAAKVVVVKCIQCGPVPIRNLLGVSSNIAMLIAAPDTRLRYLAIHRDWSSADAEMLANATCSNNSVLESLDMRVVTEEDTFESLCATLLDPACTLRRLNFSVTATNFFGKFPLTKLRAVLADPRCKLQACHLDKVICKYIIANRELEAVLEQFADAPDENWLPSDIIRQIGAYLRNNVRSRDGLDPKFAV